MELKYQELIETAQIGITELECEALGVVTYIGLTKQGDVLVQRGDDSFIALPELEFNYRKFTRLFTPETHVKYISEETLRKIHEGWVEPGYFNDEPDFMNCFKVVMHIDKAYKKDKEKLNLLEDVEDTNAQRD